MVSNLLKGVVITGFVMAATAPVALATEATETKAECEKAADKVWDEAQQKCVRKYF